MPFNKTTAAQAGKQSSRRGTPNKANADLRKVVSDLVEANLETILQDMGKLDPKDRISAWLRLLEFCIPKMNKITNELTGANGEPLETVIRFVDCSNDELYFERKEESPGSSI